MNKRSSRPLVDGNLFFRLLTELLQGGKDLDCMWTTGLMESSFFSSSVQIVLRLHYIITPLNLSASPYYQRFQFTPCLAMSAQHHRTLLSYWSHVAPCSACSRLFVVLKSDAPLRLNYMSTKPDRHIQTAQSPPCVTACKCLECERFTEWHEWTIRTL